jgi:DNA invertase Pin-like site-specific DNA recombinase
LVAAARRGGKRVGYIRVSSVDQNDVRQLDGVELDKIFRDKASGKDTRRPQLQHALDYLRDGDVLVVHSMDRLARNLDDLRKLVFELTGRGVTVQFVKESLIFTDEENNAMSKFLLSVMGAFAEFERSLIRERQREGIVLAKKKGLYRGRKKSLTPEKAEELRRRVAAGEKKVVLAREFGISRETLYQYAPITPREFPNRC